MNAEDEEEDRKEMTRMNGHFYSLIFRKGKNSRFFGRQKSQVLRGKRREIFFQKWNPRRVSL